MDDALVDATVKHLNRYLRGLVELQRLTGMRPGEAVIIRRADIDTGGDVWLYRPVYRESADTSGRDRECQRIPGADSGSYGRDLMTLSLASFGRNRLGFEADRNYKG